jgi:hypothetical protein
MAGRAGGGQAGHEREVSIVSDETDDLDLLGLNDEHESVDSR